MSQILTVSSITLLYVNRFSGYLPLIFVACVNVEAQVPSVFPVLITKRLNLEKIPALLAFLLSAFFRSSFLISTNGKKLQMFCFRWTFLGEWMLGISLCMPSLFKDRFNLNCQQPNRIPTFCGFISTFCLIQKTYFSWLDYMASGMSNLWLYSGLHSAAILPMSLLLVVVFEAYPRYCIQLSWQLTITAKYLMLCLLTFTLTVFPVYSSWSTLYLHW